MPGRNELCPCGSGKKYKHCHGAPTPRAALSPEAARLAALKALDVQLTDRLLRFARSRYGADWLDEAADFYLGDERDALTDAEMGLAIPWMLHMMPTDDADRTVAQSWRDHQGRHLSPDLQILLDAYASSWVSIWEVRAVERGVGVRAVDMLTQQERFIRDASASSTLERYETLLAIVLDCDGASFFGGAHGQPLPPREADLAVREARRMCGVRTRAVAPDVLRDTDVQHGLTLIWSLAVDRMIMRPPPELHNTDGDLVVLTRDEFALLGDRAEVTRRLASLEGVDEPEVDEGELVFTITKSGNAMHRSWDNTVLGRVAVAERSLNIQTNSTRRADELRARVEHHLAGLIRFRLRAEDNVEKLMEAARDDRAAAHERPRAGIPPEAAELARAMREEHMRTWVDDSIPALGGLTPREAAKSKSGRRKLELLLKEFEHAEARLAPEERIDLERLRGELRMPAE